MDSKNLKLAKLGFEYLEIYLSLCEWSMEMRSLVVLCSKPVEDELLSRLDALRLYFEHLEKITINDSVVFDVPLPKVPDPSTTGELRVVKIMRLSKELLEAKFPLIEIKI
jgi:hypothetical protein